MKKNNVRFAHVLCYFISLYSIVLIFTMNVKSDSYKTHWNILGFYDQWKRKSDLNMSHGEMSDFVSFALFEFTLVIKRRNSDFVESLKYILIKKDMLPGLNMSHGKMFDSVSFPLLWFTLVIKLRNFHFKGAENTLIFLIKKLCQVWLCPVK